jgi:IclR family transcriptional regulator, mhp operon transcriptional activator
MRTRNAASRTTVNGVRRTLEVLRTLNTANGSTVVELHALTAISRPALYRMLGEFESAGYVRRDDRGGYHVTHLVRSLSEGFRNDDRVADIARPVLGELQRRLLWPVDFAIYGNHAMYMRESTRRQSPLVMDRARIGLRLPLFATAAGRAYLAWCSDEERRSAIEALAKSDHPEDAMARDPRRVAQLIRQTRADGYGSRDVPVPALGGMETGAIALPVQRDGTLCAVCLTFFSKIMTVKEAAARYLEDLKEAATQIERAASPVS